MDGRSTGLLLGNLQGTIHIQRLERGDVNLLVQKSSKDMGASPQALKILPIPMANVKTLVYFDIVATGLTVLGNQEFLNYLL